MVLLHGTNQDQQGLAFDLWMKLKVRWMLPS